MFDAFLFIGDYIELLGAKKTMNCKSVDHKSYLNAFIVFSIDKKLIKITGYLFSRLYSFEYFVGNPFSIIVCFSSIFRKKCFENKTHNA